jgi:hypothetical protein
VLQEFLPKLLHLNTLAIWQREEWSDDDLDPETGYLKLPVTIKAACPSIRRVFDQCGGITHAYLWDRISEPYTVVEDVAPLCWNDIAVGYVPTVNFLIPAFLPLFAQGTPSLLSLLSNATLRSSSFLLRFPCV